MTSPVELNNFFLKFFCYITYFNETRHWTPCKRGLFVKSHCFFETIAQRFKNYNLSSLFQKMRIHDNLVPYHVSGTLSNNVLFHPLVYPMLINQKQPLGGALKKRCSEISSKFTEEHPCQSAISVKLLSIFIEITLQHGCSPVNLLHILGKNFNRNTSRWLLLINASRKLF